MKRAPLRMVMGNLIAARDMNDVWAVYRLRCHSYGTEPRRRQAQIVGGLETYARQAQADFQILRVTKRWNADDYTERLRAHTPQRAHKALWGEYLSAQREALEHVDPWQPSVFLAVRLADPQRDLQAQASRVFDRSPKEAWRDFRERSRIVGQGSLNVPEVNERVQVAERRVTASLDARPASPEEIQWLIRRAFCRGLADPVIAPAEPSENPYQEAIRAMLRWQKEDGVSRYHRYVVAHSEAGDSYQAGLCLGEMGHATPFTRQCELMFTPLEEQSFPADAALNVRWVPGEQAQRRAAHQLARTHHQLADEAQSEIGAKDAGYRRAELARELHSELSYSGAPLLFATLSLIVAADSFDEMQRRVRLLRESYPWPLYRPMGDQLDVFQQHLPGQRSLAVGFERPFTVQQVGAMVPTGTHEAGSDTPRAVYIAKTLNGGQPVRIDLREAADSNQPPTIALIGTLGGGKTMLAQMLLYQAFLQGARIVDTDPKADHKLHLHPHVAPYAHVIHLGPDPEHAGKLDPLRIAPPDERHDAAATFLLDVLPTGISPGIHAAVNGAVTRVIDAHGKRAACWEVIRALGEGPDPDDRQAGEWLAKYAAGGVARLGFAKLSDPLPTSAAAQYTYLQIRALKRAAESTARSEMSQSHRHGRAVLSLVALYAMRIVGDERDRLKVLAFDEASFLAQDAVGQQHIDQLVRWGRSELAVALLSTQLLGDITAQDNLIGQYFVFKMKSRDHARASLDAMELDGDGPLNHALTERYEDGMCLYRDLRGHCEELQVDLGALLAPLKTTPPAEVRAVEELRSVV